MKSASNKKRIVAFLLSSFFGVFGAQRYYVGRTGSAVAMTLISITMVGLFITSIWNFVDWVMIISGSFKDSEGKVLTNWD
jgi:TM2 domain-containing membrane protein YozV